MVADRRAGGRPAEPGGPGGRPLRPGTAAAVALFGLLVVTAAVQTSRDAQGAASSREALVASVTDRQDRVATLQSRLAALREQTTDLASGLDRLGREVRSTDGEVERLSAWTGFAPVTGPGIRAVVDNAPQGGDEGRVRDEDLAMLVDGLWNAGAEAISVNGRRLTALSPIRSSGLAIHVDNAPVSPPYLVLAVGDSGDLQSRFAESAHGLRWLSLARTYGFVFRMENQEQVSLPGARLPTLRQVRLAPQNVEDS